LADGVFERRMPLLDQLGIEARLRAEAPADDTDELGTPILTAAARYWESTSRSLAESVRQSRGTLVAAVDDMRGGEAHFIEEVDSGEETGLIVAPGG
jgi:hypothetical protein